ncbi:hypothetical protein CN988_28610 [Bacillus thuringiensis]|nr:hypothetical protein COM74_03305 [Bacillus thuringiensis]PES54583.1 hypothetical protein CN499_07910 [Bacillus thuringiensis]PFC01018.1 hypothetical protein CN302_10785 [Bacillus thuringiensis]PFD66962.1 hypothetical protein CN309_08285 [Bacillus thuringiensis]PFE11282.1 hypothetical protein CN304_29705 [Bacillus thuringiensis]
MLNTSIIINDKIFLIGFIETPPLILIICFNIEIQDYCIREKNNFVIICKSKKFCRFVKSRSIDIAILRVGFIAIQSPERDFLLICNKKAYFFVLEYFLIFRLMGMRLYPNKTLYYFS